MNNRENGFGFSVEKKPEPEFEEFEGESFEQIDDANIPVNIFLSKDDDFENNGMWVLSADNFMPRLYGEHVPDAASFYSIRSKDPEVLRKVVKDKIIPLYETALNELREIAEGKSDDLYFWKKRK